MTLRLNQGFLPKVNFISNSTDLAVFHESECLLLCPAHTLQYYGEWMAVILLSDQLFLQVLQNPNGMSVAVIFQTPSPFVLTLWQKLPRYKSQPR